MQVTAFIRVLNYMRLEQRPTKYLEIIKQKKWRGFVKPKWQLQVKQTGWLSPILLHCHNRIYGRSAWRLQLKVLFFAFRVWELRALTLPACVFLWSAIQDQRAYTNHGVSGWADELKAHPALRFLPEPIARCPKAGPRPKPSPCSLASLKGKGECKRYWCKRRLCLSPFEQHGANRC